MSSRAGAKFSRRMCNVIDGNGPLPPKIIPLTMLAGNSGELRHDMPCSPEEQRREQDKVGQRSPCVWFDPIAKKMNRA